MNEDIKNAINYLEKNAIHYRCDNDCARCGIEGTCGNMKIQSAINTIKEALKNE